MDFEPIHKELASDQVIHQIKERIENKVFNPGVKLPSEMEMARSLNVGRSTVREALKALIHIGILERKGKQTFVARAPFDTTLLVSGLAHYRDNKDAVDMMEVRRFLEVHLSELAAERADETDIKDLENCVKQMREGINNPISFIEADQRFHLRLSRATKNKIFSQMIESIRMSLGENVELIIRHRPEIVHKSLHYHEEVLKAIKQNQVKKARKAMKDHLEDVESEFRAILRAK